MLAYNQVLLYRESTPCGRLWLVGGLGTHFQVSDEGVRIRVSGTGKFLEISMAIYLKAHQLWDQPRVIIGGENTKALRQFGVLEYEQILHVLPVEQAAANAGHWSSVLGPCSLRASDRVFVSELVPFVSLGSPRLVVMVPYLGFHDAWWR